MLWKLVLRLHLVSGVAFSEAPQVVPAKTDEILTYECARKVSTMVGSSPQIGPVFSEGVLIFTSTETRGGGRALIVSAGGGTYAIDLKREGINKLRFELASQESLKPKVFFLTYVHDSIFRSRYFDFSVGQPPEGRSVSEYDFVRAHRAAPMLPNLEYAIYETSENTVMAVTEGRMNRNQMSRRKVDSCEHITRRTPGLARNLRHNLDVLELILLGPPLPKKTQGPSRMPAGVAKAKPVRLN